MRLGSTKGTNALLERKGAKTALLITQGFEDLLLIGTQQRPALFALQVIKRIPLYDKVLGIKERIDARGNTILPLEEQEIDRLIQEIQDGELESVAIACMHSYINPVHEEKLKSRLRLADIPFISLSSELAPAIKFLPRAETALTNAYLDPIIRNYLEGVSGQLPKGSLSVMSSAGGLVKEHLFTPKDSLLSGPAGGVVGAAHIAQKADVQKLLTLDMGGTSTDVARYDAQFDYRFETRVGDALLLSPSLAIETVAAGGGSICSFDGYKLTVGPESAGAYPGPACYGAGGPLTITDVNLLLGRMDPRQFRVPVDLKAAQNALQDLTQKTGLVKSEVLTGLLKIANEKMADAIRNISVRQGYDPVDFSLLAFGGAGGQHACQVAELLGIQKLLIPYNAGLLSAYGIGQARVERILSRQILKKWEDVQAELKKEWRALEEEVLQLLAQEGFPKKACELEKWIYLRLQGQEQVLELKVEKGMNIPKVYRKKYEQTFGHWIKGKALELESIRIIGWGKRQGAASEPIEEKAYVPKPAYHLEYPVYQWEKLSPGAEITGPAIVVSENSTSFIDEDWHWRLNAELTAVVHQRLSIGEQEKASTESKIDPIQLELFTNRFRAVADQMGALLERTAFSVNVKERLDFSCALLDAAGELIVNAPHIPVHLGSLGVCTRLVDAVLDMKEGDVAITNHPGFGGSHLPDITLIRPVFYEGTRVAYIANRAHHAEVGGKRPGSMPPDAQSLVEEGVVIPPMLLVKAGKAKWRTIESLLKKAPYPTRALSENMADLRAGLASLEAGHQAVLDLCRSFGPLAVGSYMHALKDYSASRLIEALRNLPARTYTAEELLDDGSPIRVSIQIKDQKLSIDFTGSAGLHPGNLNANLSIITSVSLYLLRLLVKEDIPLNEGLMQQVELIIPQGMLNPDFPDDPAKCPAVVGGNIETSQRTVDTLLKAMEMAACSQGTMNNVLFGNAQFGYYETICAGVGAGPDFHGADAVHQHMTNTRITDPEILEFRYPVRLDRFAIRRASGGAGQWKGGDGVIRAMTFLEPVELTVLTQHRVVPPYGMKGGAPGSLGKQYVIKGEGERVELKGIDAVDMEVGDRFVIETPGGGGWGEEGAG